LTLSAFDRSKTFINAALATKYKNIFVQNSGDWIDTGVNAEYQYPRRTTAGRP